MENAVFETCKKSANTSCDTPKNQPTIRLVTPDTSDLTMTTAGGLISLNSPIANILNIQSNGSIVASSRVSFEPKDSGTLGLEMSVMLDGEEVATLVYMMDSTLSVERVTQVSDASPKNTPVILSSGFSIQKTPGNPLNPATLGYKIFRLTGSTELDETKNGPGHTDSIGALSEVPGVGWQ